VILLGQNGPGLKLTIHLFLVLKVKMFEAITAVNGVHTDIFTFCRPDWFCEVGIFVRWKVTLHSILM
jgi:hypothetical protein